MSSADKQTLNEVASTHQEAKEAEKRAKELRVAAAQAEEDAAAAKKRAREVADREAAKERRKAALDSPEHLYFAGREIKVSGRVIAKGEPVQEAATWPNLISHLATGTILQFPKPLLEEYAAKTVQAKLDALDADFNDAVRREVDALTAEARNAAAAAEARAEAAEASKVRTEAENAELRALAKATAATGATNGRRKKPEDASGKDAGLDTIPPPPDAPAAPDAASVDVPGAVT